MCECSVQRRQTVFYCSLSFLELDCLDKMEQKYLILIQERVVLEVTVKSFY